MIIWITSYHLHVPNLLSKKTRIQEMIAPADRRLLAASVDLQTYNNMTENGADQAIQDLM